MREAPAGVDLPATCHPGIVKPCQLVIPSISCGACHARYQLLMLQTYRCVRRWLFVAAPGVAWRCAGDMLGLGALTLPSVFARLGWLPASVLLAACALGALMSGRLFARMAQQVRQAHWPHDTQMSACLTDPWSHLAEGPSWDCCILLPVMVQWECCKEELGMHCMHPTSSCGSSTLQQEPCQCLTMCSSGTASHARTRGFGGTWLEAEVRGGAGAQRQGV